jgi:nucleotide-binding universal stress UspA family protein
MFDSRVPRILAPVDLGHSSEAALRCAQMLVSRLGAELTVMYANDALTLQSYDQIYTGYRDLPEEQEELMEDAVRAFAAPHLGDTKYDVLVVADDAARAIATAAERRDASLIVLGTHGRHGWHRWLDGSVTESVMRATDRPVLSVPQCVDKRQVSALLCPVNFTPLARHAVKAACHLADWLEVQLHVVHVVAEKSRSELSSLRSAIREWIDPATEHRCEFRQIVHRSGSAAEHILECCNDVGADLVVVGGGRHPHRMQPGRPTTVDRLIRTAKVPIMSVVRPWVTEAA